MTCAVVLRESDALIGAISLMEVSATHARAEIGYWIGAASWGQGYCTEAVRRLLPFAQAHFGTTKFIARCFARNPASARVIEKAGFALEGRLASHICKNGRFEDVLLFGLVLPKRLR